MSPQAPNLFGIFDDILLIHFQGYADFSLCDGDEE